MLAERGHDLVLGDPAPDVVAEFEQAGAAVEVVERAAELADPASSERLVAASLERFGRIDAAAVFAGTIVTGRFMKSSVDDLRKVVEGCLVAPYHFRWSPP